MRTLVVGLLYVSACLGPLTALAQNLNFPADFVWGTGTSAYQIEGGVTEGGRGQSIWDVFSHTPGKTVNGDTGDVACDHYHRWKADVALMKAMGLKTYRFSISWPRIQPNGTGPAVLAGAQFYNGLINELIANNITPIATLYHWDLPQALETAQGGWLNDKIADQFGEYSRICFKLFGDRVKQWLTLNEPWCSSVLGYDAGGIHAPGVLTMPGVGVYKVARNLLRAHGKAVNTYRTMFQATQRGRIGLTLNLDWYKPKPTTNATQFALNQAAATRAMQFMLGMFADPIYKGDWPAVVKTRVGPRLPAFTANDTALIYNSTDFFGLNHYTSHWAEWPAYYKPVASNTSTGYYADVGVTGSNDPSAAVTDYGWTIDSGALRSALNWIQQSYNPTGGIYIFENGAAVNEPNVTVAQQDTARINYLRAYITNVYNAIKLDGVDVKGYFVWSFMDNFEWNMGYTKRFGVHYVNYTTLVRTPKQSSQWFYQIMKNNALPGPAPSGR